MEPPSLVPSHRLRPSPENRRVGSCITRFEACSAFTRIMACTLAKSPSRPSTPKASATSLPPPLLRLLPGGANQFPGGSVPRCGPAPFHGALFSSSDIPKKPYTGWSAHIRNHWPTSPGGNLPHRRISGVCRSTCPRLRLYVQVDRFLRRSKRPNGRRSNSECYGRFIANYGTSTPATCSSRVHHDRGCTPSGPLYSIPSSSIHARSTEHHQRITQQTP